MLRTCNCARLCTSISPASFVRVQAHGYSIHQLSRRSSITRPSSLSVAPPDRSASSLGSRALSISTGPGHIPQSAIGLELHVQLASNAKLFSSAKAPSYDQDSNTNVDLFDAATPGVQPILSPDCLRLAIVASLALECNISQTSSFDRKHYFYPDLPSGYQITQHYAPIATGGRVQVTPEDGADRTIEVRITQLQLEQDTAKSYADPAAPDQTLIDLNRSGAALIEIVTAPDLRSAKEASAFVRKLQSILRFAGVTKGNMEQGSLRCDVNVSVTLPGSTSQGSRCEVKNVNGFGHIEHAVAFEIARQTALLAQGERVEMETRGFDVSRRQTFKLRDKETATDYRYLPDPDLPQVIIPPSVVERLRELVPELPVAMSRRLQASYGLTRTTAEVIMMIGSERIDKLSHVGCAVRYFEAVMKSCHGRVDGQAVANWIVHELLGQLAKYELRFIDCPVSPVELAELVTMTSQGVLPRPIARQILARSIQPPHTPLSELLKEAAKEDSNKSLGPEASARTLAGELISDMGQEAKLIKAGNVRIVGKLIGEGMRRSRQKVDPVLLRKALGELLGLGDEEVGDVKKKNS